jgi:hypothetical protein
MALSNDLSSCYKFAAMFKSTCNSLTVPYNTSTLKLTDLEAITCSGIAQEDCVGTYDVSTGCTW